MTECYVDTKGCTVCPEIPGHPAVAPKEVSDANLGWNAGGNSVVTIDGNLHLTCTMPQSVLGVVIGLKSMRRGVGIPEQIEHGFYFFTTLGVNNYAVVERGVTVTSTQTRAPGLGETFEIRRSGERVYYLVDGVLLHTSDLRSTGVKLASSCLYASTDEIGAVVFESVGVVMYDDVAIRLGALRVMASDGDVAQIGIGRLGVSFSQAFSDGVVFGLGHLGVRVADGDRVSVPLGSLGVQVSQFSPPQGGITIAGLGTLGVTVAGQKTTFGDVEVALGLLGVAAADHDYIQVRLPKLRVFCTDVDPLADAFLIAAQSDGFAALDGGVLSHLLEDTVAFSESHSAQGVLALLDAIAFSDALSDTVNIPAAIAVSVAFGDRLLGGIGGSVGDSVAFGSTNVVLALHIASLIDGLTLAAQASSSAMLFGFVADTFAFGDAIDIKQQILAALSDGVEFGIALYTGEDTFTAWVMTPETRAMRSYSNFPFNSYAVFGGKLIAAKDDGVYVLSGDTDAGRAIHGSVRSGLLDFGTRQLKRMDRAYLGYTADGTLGLRVATTSPEGKKVEFSYRMEKPQIAEAPRETRVKIGKGLMSVYWQFELNNNLDGGRFELHDVTVLPITLSRKVR